ncbi:magnesium and cobalt transporter [Luteibacter rhizovicinus]|uniref:Magnesium and cobalt efflux protein CorC n=2 Tax=Luteibacter rhizovicinus TaxID=242606 RepID=A0A4R3YQ73_9GAMM|nr:magnesium and cobalt transporter [Luteibacter rhizovicinus]
MFSGEPRNRDELIEELRAAQANGLLSNDTLTMVEGAIKVTELSVDDVMVPRAQIVMLSADAPLSDILPIVVESGHSRFPVHGDDKDEILGILLAKDILKYFGQSEAGDVRALLRPAVLIPESMRLNVLLAEFRLTRNHMALVVDEYGGVAGLITIEDVLEQIVGEIDDEHDDEEEPILVHTLDDGGFAVSALTPIADFNEHAGASFSDEEFDTVGGMITSEFGHLPEAGEEIAVGDFVFRVTEADDRRVQQFHVSRKSNES